MICTLSDLGKPRNGISEAGTSAGVPRVRDDPHEAILSQWASCPALISIAGEPLVRRLVVDVHRVEECDKDVDVEQSFHNSTP